MHEHLRYIQHMLVFHTQPVRRIADNSLHIRQTLAVRGGRTLADLTEVGFKGGRHGRFTWRADGEDLYLQYLPPALAGLACPPELLIAQMEILLPIFHGGQWEYPFAEVRPVVREFYERFGLDRLTWGSDMPNVERHCTYRQSLDYLRRHCDFIPAEAMKKILGGNVARLFESSSRAGAQRPQASSPDWS